MPTKHFPNNKKPQDLYVLVPVNKIYREAVDYRNYLLIKRSTKYSSCITDKIFKWQTKLKVPIYLQYFDPDEAVSIMECLPSYMTSGDTLVFHEFAAVWIGKCQ